MPEQKRKKASAKASETSSKKARGEERKEGTNKHDTNNISTYFFVHTHQNSCPVYLPVFVLFYIMQLGRRKMKRMLTTMLHY